MVSYELIRLGDSVRLIVNRSHSDTPDIDIVIEDYEGYFHDAAIITELQTMILDMDIVSWDGFNEYNDDVLDGSEFTLSIEYGINEIFAHGYESFPDGYAQVERELDGFFEKLALNANEQN